MPSSSERGSPLANASVDVRRQALLALARVDARGAHAARLLGDAPGAVRELVQGVLRWQLTLDALLSGAVHQPLAALEPRVRAALRIGLYEARRGGTPVPVAVSEAVRLTRRESPGAAGLVNAVLRRVTQLPWPEDDEGAPLWLRTSHPAWLVERWFRLLGEELTRRALAANQQPAPLTLLAAATRREELVARGVGLEAHPAVPGVLVVTAGAAAAARALAEGAAYAMDATAVAVARLLPAAAGPALDLTAAPGGKSLVLASERRDGVLAACDRTVGRVRLLRRTLTLVGEGGRVIVADAGAPPLRPSSLAAAVLDAPCSGTGTLRRHPELRGRLAESALAGLAAAQRRLLERACELLAPGGVLLYATCSLEPEENGEVVAQCPLERVDPRAALPPGLPAVALASGGVAVAPSELGDGFTVHLLRRA